MLDLALHFLLYFFFFIEFVHFWQTCKLAHGRNSKLKINIKVREKKTDRFVILNV